MLSGSFFSPDSSLLTASEGKNIFPLIHVYARKEGLSSVLICDDKDFPCSIGRSGIVQNKTEGDGASPAGLWRFRRLFYRPDRIIGEKNGTIIDTLLPQTALNPNDIWCDDSSHSLYNCYGKRDDPLFLHSNGDMARHESLWRDDGVYDLIIVLGYNDAPIVSGLGSAIFIHLMSPEKTPTEGCIALLRDDFLFLARHVSPKSFIHISPAPY